MNAKLLIGDAAKLAGVTAKTIRHYHKLGLLMEPERTEADYRLYTAGHLLRIHQIKQLQGLGLSLQQIKEILDETVQGELLESGLRMLHAEIVAQIEELQARREAIEALLEEDSPSLLERTEETPPTLKLLQEQLGDQLQIDSFTWAGRSKQIAQLDALFWGHAEYREQQQELVEQIKAHPQELRQVVSLLSQVARLADEAEDSAVVETLAKEIVCLHEDNILLAQLAELIFSPEFSPDLWNEILGVDGDAPMAPAHRRLLALVAERLSSASVIV